MEQLPKTREMDADIARFQAEHHPLEQIDNFASVEEYCLHLIHLKAYEEAALHSRGKNVLDLGCNVGYGTRVLAAVAREVVGVDLSPSAVSEAKRLGEGINFTFQCMSAERLPFEDERFEMVVSFQVIEHVADYDRYLSEIIRVLKPNGLAIFTTPNARIRLDPGMKPWSAFHVREFSAVELADLLANWFPSLEVKGVFGKKELYDVEYARVQRSLLRARKRARAIFPPYVEIRTKAISLVKRILPASITAEVQRLVRRSTLGQKTPEMPSHSATSESLRVFLKGYTTADLHYSSVNLDAALDLMAVCRKGTAE